MKHTIKLLHVRSGINEEEFEMIIRKETVADNEAITQSS